MKLPKYRYLPFGYKLMLSYCIFIVIPVLLIGYLSNAVYQNSIREQTNSSVQGTLTQMSDNISYKINDIIRISDLFYYDYSLARHVRNYEEGWVSYEATTKYLLPKIASYIEATSQRLWMSIYFHNEDFPEVYRVFKGEDPLGSNENRYDLYHLSRIKEKPWYRNFPEEKYGETMVWQRIEDDFSFNRISLLRRLLNVQVTTTMQEIGFMRISVPLPALFETVDYTKIGNGATIFIRDETNRIVKASGDAYYRYDQPWDRSLYKDYLILDHDIPGFGWKISAVIPNQIFEQNVREVKLLTFLICLLFTVVYFISGALMSNYFSRKVGKIVSVLHSFQEGNFTKRIFFKGQDEFSQISLALNEMGQNIGELIHKVYVADLDKKEAELDMLQAQINPHFLYNTLSSINRLAKFGELDKLQRMVMDLAKFYRLTLNEGRTILTVADELEQAKAYIRIQKTKYEDRMSVSYHIDEEILGHSTIKLIIQPFIENVLEHAWCADRIHIRIVAYRERDSIYFKVIDDGVGISAGLLKQMQDPEESANTGYGIRNVNQRIKLYYGQGYGVHIHSRLGIGTTVLIRIPVNRMEGRTIE
ncbi:sensor histidine kinase [Paenibacillus pinihumi]|uniref:sensor histidine kinase n=1 Tax=Paenibacillus pinihumi TaxID=669462 RepID=UPI00041FBE0E|nr:sensor histidine kinase [Paenibacillus pinihumi]